MPERTDIQNQFHRAYVFDTFALKQASEEAVKAVEQGKKNKYTREREQAP